MQSFHCLYCALFYVCTPIDVECLQADTNLGITKQTWNKLGKTI